MKAHRPEPEESWQDRQFDEQHRQVLPMSNIIHWVAVSDAQPEKRDTYFVCDDLGFMGFRTWKDTFWEGDNIVGEPKVTHWTIVEPPCI